MYIALVSGYYLYIALVSSYYLNIALVSGYYLYIALVSGYYLYIALVSGYYFYIALVSGYYLYIAPSGVATLEQRAILVGPVYAIASATCILNIWFVFSGAKMGEMSMYMINMKDKTETLLWQIEGDQGTDWKLQVIGIGRRKDPYQVLGPSFTELLSRS